MVLGAPNKRREQITATERTVTWVYTRTTSRQVGEKPTGYKDRERINKKTGQKEVYREPTYEPVYEYDEVEVHCVTFLNGTVTEIVHNS